VDDLIIDQLTFMEAAQVSRNDTRPGVLRTILHDLHVLIGDAALPCALAHQINRKGVEYARQHGHYEADHAAEGSEAERTVDMLATLYASHQQRVTGRMSLQWLAARRFPLRDFELIWQMSSATIAARNVITP
jgi:hypothetical protein